MSKDLVIIMCPPLSSYKDAPRDQSQCELFDCPKCKEKMWLSQKKKGALMMASFIGSEVFLCCYDCLKKEVMRDPTFFVDSKQIDL